MDISATEDYAALEAVARASGDGGDWADVMPAIRSAVASEKVGLWRQSATSRGLIERHRDLMNIARITVAGQQVLRDLREAEAGHPA